MGHDPEKAKARDERYGISAARARREEAEEEETKPRRKAKDEE